MSSVYQTMWKVKHPYLKLVYLFICSIFVCRKYIHILFIGRYLFVIDWGTLYIFSYDGSLLATPKIVNHHLTNLTNDLISSTKELVAVRSPNDAKTVHCCQLRAERSLSNDKLLTHTCEIVKIDLDPCSVTADQMLAFLDAARDLFLLTVPATGTKRNQPPLKICNQLQKWS